MKDNLSPEDKLLKLIRGEKRPKPLEPVGADNSLNKKIEPAQTDLKGASVNRILPLAKGFFTENLTKKLVFFVIAISFLFLFIVFIYPLVALKNIKLPAVSAKQKLETTSPVKGKESKPYEFYLEGMRAHAMFGNLAAQENEPSAIATEATSVKDLNLVGVIMGDVPQAIIEDKKAQKTYYVTKGQVIGDFQVEEITEGKVILNYKGQRYELNV